MPSSKNTCIWSFLYSDLENNDYLNGFAHSQLQQVFFDLMWHVIGPLLRQQQLLQSVVMKLSVVYVTELAAQCASMWLYYTPVVSDKNTFIKCWWTIPGLLPESHAGQTCNVTSVWTVTSSVTKDWMDRAVEKCWQIQLKVAGDDLKFRTKSVSVKPFTLAPPLMTLTGSSSDWSTKSCN